MIQISPKLSFTEYLTYDDGIGTCDELVGGELQALGQPTGTHRYC